MMPGEIGKGVGVGRDGAPSGDELLSVASGPAAPDAREKAPFGNDAAAEIRVDREIVEFRLGQHEVEIGPVGHAAPLPRMPGR